MKHYFLLLTLASWSALSLAADDGCALRIGKKRRTDSSTMGYQNFLLAVPDDSLKGVTLNDSNRTAYLNFIRRLVIFLNSDFSDDELSSDRDAVLQELLNDFVIFCIDVPSLNAMSDCVPTVEKDDASFASIPVLLSALALHSIFFCKDEALLIGMCEAGFLEALMQHACIFFEDEGLDYEEGSGIGFIALFAEKTKKQGFL